MQAIHIILFIVYGGLLSAGVYHLPFFKRSGIRPSLLLLLFWFRVLAGLVHNWAAWHYYPNHGDVWLYFNESVELKYYLLHNPQHFLDSHILGGSLTAVGESSSFWSFLSYKLIFDVNVLLDFLSFNNLYINTLLFAFPVFISSLFLYRLFTLQFSGDHLAAFAALIIPSTLYWTACIHKEGYLFLFLGPLLWYWTKKLDHVTMMNTLYCALLSVSVFLFRNTLVFSLAPALVLWTKAYFMIGAAVSPPGDTAGNGKIMRRLALYTIAMVVLLLTLSVMAGGAFDVFHMVSERQQAFNQLQGGSRIYFPVLQPTFNSFLQALPFAVLNGFFQPLPGVGGQFIYNAFFLEMAVIWTLVVMAAGRYLLHPPRRPLSPFTLFCLVFALMGFLQTGYTIPFAGSIIRYRSLFLPFLLAPFLHGLRHQKAFKKAGQWLADHVLVKPS